MLFCFRGQSHNLGMETCSKENITAEAVQVEDLPVRNHPSLGVFKELHKFARSKWCNSPRKWTNNGDVPQWKLVHPNRYRKMQMHTRTHTHNLKSFKFSCSAVDSYFSLNSKRICYMHITQPSQIHDTHLNFKTKIFTTQFNIQKLV